MMTRWQMLPAPLLRPPPLPSPQCPRRWVSDGLVAGTPLGDACSLFSTAMVCGLQEARLELERLIAAGSHDMSLQQLCGAFPYTLDAFQQRSVESFLQGKAVVGFCQMRRYKCGQVYG